MKRPIGIIDSGIGGLTVMQEIMRQLPRENLIYLGDIARCPYGSRKEEEIKRYTLEMVDFLLEKNIKLLVIACNTATAYTLEVLTESLDIPVIGVIQPGARTAIKNSVNQNIAVIGTEATIKSGKYEKELLSIHPTVKVKSFACPTFVPLIEKGYFHGVILEQEVENSLKSLENEKVDTLILGCTHYPLIKEAIQNTLGDKIIIVSSSEETAREVGAVLNLYKLNNRSDSDPQYQFYTTGEAETFFKLTKRLFNIYIKDIELIRVEKVSI